MAKATTAKAPKKVKKAGKAVSLKAKPDGGKKGGKTSTKGKAKDGIEALWRLAEHPLVGELLAIGATAAVVAIAEQPPSDKGKKKSASSKAVKAAGKAAAAAIGARLLSEFAEAKKAGKPLKPAKAKV
jgi:hypothetical protein